MNEGLQAGAKNPSQQFTGGATMYSAAEKDVEVQHSKKKNGRFVNPWPEFRMPGAGGLMKFLWESGYAAIPCDEVCVIPCDEVCHIPCDEVFVITCDEAFVIPFDEVCVISSDEVLCYFF